MATLKKRIERTEEIADPNVVKVVTDREGDAIIFPGRRFLICGTPAQNPRPTLSTSACMCINASFCWLSGSPPRAARASGAPRATARD